MTILSTLWSAGKVTGNYLKGVVDITLTPGEPAPKTDLHPRMPARPATFGELVRMFPYRHYWKHVVLFRFIVISFAIVYTGKFIIFSNYLINNLANEGKELEHHIPTSIAYGRRQKEQDVEYFMKNDPKEKLRPRFFKETFSIFAINYFPKGYTEEKH